jgi:hypothetical protein
MAEFEGAPEETMVYGSDYPNMLDWFREQRETSNRIALAERGELQKHTLREYIRVTHFSLITDLASASWPNEYSTRTSLTRRSESDWQLYPYFGKYSPWFPGYLQNDITALEYEGSDKVDPNVVIKWCNRNATRLQEIWAREVIEPMLRRMQAVIV